MIDLSPISWATVAVILATIGVALLKRFPATGVLVIGNLMVFLLSEFGPTKLLPIGQDGPLTIYTRVSVVRTELALDSSHIVHPSLNGGIELLSHMFLHAGLAHIFGNMLMLLLLGLPFEQRIGARRFVAIYLAAGAIGALAETLFLTWQGDPGLMVGASGAVAGIIGAFAATYPNVIVPMPVPVFIVSIFIRMRVWVGAVLFIGLQLVLLLSHEVTDNTAYVAHIGGLGGGIVVGLLVLGRNRPQVEGGRGSGPVAVDLASLAPFARDAQTQATLTHMQTNHDEPEVFQAWLDKFFRTATCPTCAHKVMPRAKGQVVCTQGHQFDVRQGKASQQTV